MKIIILSLSLFFLVLPKYYQNFRVIFLTQNYLSDQVGVDLPLSLKSRLNCYADCSIWFPDSIRIDEEIKDESYFRQFIKRVRILKDYQDQRILKQDLVHDSLTAYLVTPKPLEWKVYRDKIKNILGLKCFFAEAKTNKQNKNGEHITYIAWFTEELNRSDGPFDYAFSLPGTILEIRKAPNGPHTIAKNIQLIEEGSADVKLEAIQVIEPDFSQRNQFYMRGDLDPKYYLDPNSPMGVWIPMPD